MSNTFNKTPIDICPSKPKGEVIVYKKVLIRLPKEAGNSATIGFNRKKENQKWFRQESPENLTVNTVDEHEEFIDREFDRIENGIWIMINGKKTYLTGMHYYYLNYIQIDIGYPDYRDRDRLFFYFLEASIKHSKSLGVTLVKPRRFGATWMAVAYVLHALTRTKNAIGGLMSKTGEDAKDFFKEKLAFSFVKLPFWLQPTTSSGNNPTSSIDFTEPTTRTKESAQNINKGAGLDSYIRWKTTTENAFDGKKLLRWFFDEIGKLKKEVNLSKTVNIHSKCLRTGRKIVGHGFLPSTVNELEKGGEEYEDFFMQSVLDEENEYEQTPSGFWGVFIPAYDGLEGFIDEYGGSVIDDPKEPVMGVDGELITEGSKTFLLRERKLKEGNPSSLIEEKRQMPWTIEEAFYKSALDCHFDAGRIQEQQEYNENLLNNKVVRGEFFWEGTPYESDVEFIPSSNGNFYTSWIPSKEQSNQRFYRGDKVYPSNSHLGLCGMDSYDIDKAIDSRGSDGGFHVYNKISIDDNAPSKAFVLEYIHRPKSAFKFYEDVLKAAQYYGYPILIENNKYGAVRYAEERGYGGYFMDRPRHTLPKHNRNKAAASKTKGVPSNSEDIINAHAESIQIYVLKHVGEMENGEMGDMPFNRTLEDWKQFDINNRTKYDATISSGLCLLGASAPVKTKRVIKKAVFVKRGNITG